MEIVANELAEDWFRSLKKSLAYVCLFAFFSFIFYQLQGKSFENKEDKLAINLIQTNSTRMDTLDALKLPYLRTYNGQFRALDLIKNTRLFYPNAKLTILPETIFSYDFFGTTDPKAIEIKKRLEEEVLLQGGDFLFGAVTLNSNGLPENSAVHLRFVNNEFVYTKYPKRYLMPFGESLPGSTRFPWLGDIFFHPVIATGNFSPIYIDVNGFMFGIIICNEVYHPNLFALHKGIDAMIHIGNETWISNTSAQASVLSKDIMRSIENNISILKVSNSGLSGVIDNRGDVSQLTPSSQESILQVNLSKRYNEITPYQKRSDYFLWFLVFISLTIGVCLISSKLIVRGHKRV